MMRKMLGLALAGTMVFGLASPVGAQTKKYDAYTRVYPFKEKGYPGIDVWVYRRIAQNIPAGLRYIKVCLQRKSGTSYVTRSCKKTNADGGVTWLLYAKHRYRIYVPPTAYHHAHYSGSFVA
jgi:hypothetical protein